MLGFMLGAVIVVAFCIAMAGCVGTSLL